VLVEDGAIVVLGGLLQDDYAGNQDKVPGISDVPFFGNLFKSEARSRKKTNLMVFLRPVVVRDAAATDRLSLDRYDLMRAGVKDAQPVPNDMVPINEGPQLPAITLPAKPAAPAAPATPLAPKP
jgi:general secretion pathway protein D